MPRLASSRPCPCARFPRPCRRVWVERETMSSASTIEEAASRKSFCAIGVDVGGTKIAAGLVRFPEGEVHSRRQISSAPARGGDAVFADVQRLCEELAAVAQRQNQIV